MDGWAQRRLFDRIVSHVRDRVAQGWRPDLVFLTGDIANTGSKREYEEFRQQFYTPLVAALGGPSWDGCVYAVPGNHDIDRAAASFFDREQALAPGSRFFDPDKTGKTARSQLSPRFKQYRQLMPCDVSGNWLTSEVGTFFDLYESPEGSVSIVGINTAWLSKDNHDLGKLSPGVALAELAIRRGAEAGACIVLGHHPLHWLRQEHQSLLGAVFGQSHVIYLHGHLHQADGRRDEGGAMDFLSFQAGAAFQARDDEPWLNGLTWGEVDLAESKLRLQPRSWNPKNLDWPVASGRFPELLRPEGSEWWIWPLPSSPIAAAGSRSTQSRAAPRGWEIFDAEALSPINHEVDRYLAAKYFDGADPDWEIARTTLIRPLTKVDELVIRLTSPGDSSKARVTAVLGPSGEGKSTALRQALVRVLTQFPGKGLLWRTDDSARIDASALAALPSRSQGWLIAADNADLVADSLHSLARVLLQQGNTEVQIVFAARDSDWRASGANRLDWRPAADYLEMHLSGLTLRDAEIVASNWLAHGAERSEQLGSLQPQDIPAALFEAARTDGGGRDGALLGAMLRVRIGPHLHAHVRTLVQKLRTIQINPSYSLGDAFAFIASMHNAGQFYLSREVLAQRLGLDLTALHSTVLFPLAREAAATGGTFISTRHRNIARAAIEVLQQDFGVDVDDLFVQLAGAALEARQTGWIPELPKWEFALPAHFARRNPSLAVRIGRRLVAARPTDLFLATNLARLYRESGDPSAAASLLSGHLSSQIVNRAFWFELGSSTAGPTKPALWLLLAAWSVADQSGLGTPTVMHASIVLPAISLAFRTLHERYLLPNFLKSQVAAARLGLLVARPGEDRDYLLRLLPPAFSRSEQLLISAVEDLIEVIRECMDEAWRFEPTDDERFRNIPRASLMQFTELTGVLTRASSKLQG